MNILVIKQTSLGDVLHSTAAIRAIKTRYPQSHLSVLTANASLDIYRHNPHIDELIALDYPGIKRQWRQPLHVVRHLRAVIRQLRARHFALAFDLQGLGRTALFLYAARADQKFIKGRWPFVGGFRNKQLHAIAEMQGVLQCAGINAAGVAMEWHGGDAERRFVDNLLVRINPRNQPLVVFSPFSRWASKDWPLAHYLELAAQIDARACVVITAQAAHQPSIARALRARELHCVNLAGALSVAQFAELVGRAQVQVSGDSFPMHVACAKQIAAIALFAPTDEAKVGPQGGDVQLLRAPGCRRCERADCRRNCMARLSTDAVGGALLARLDALARG